MHPGTGHRWRVVAHHKLETGATNGEECLLEEMKRDHMDESSSYRLTIFKQKSCEVPSPPVPYWRMGLGIVEGERMLQHHEGHLLHPPWRLQQVSTAPKGLMPPGPSTFSTSTPTWAYHVMAHGVGPCVPMQAKAATHNMSSVPCPFSASPRNSGSAVVPPPF